MQNHILDQSDGVILNKLQVGKTQISSTNLHPLLINKQKKQKKPQKTNKFQPCLL